MLPASVASATEGPSAGPIWLTRSKYVSSYWREILTKRAVGKAHVVAVESRGRSQKEAGRDDARDDGQGAGDVSLYKLPSESKTITRCTRAAAKTFRRTFEF
jgi:hypothetical protein